MTRTTLGELTGRMMAVCGGTVALLVVLAASPATAADRSLPQETALQAASWLTTIPYGAVKMAYALGGGIVGSFAWVVTGGNTRVAEGVWIPSMTGDYIVRPENLTGERILHFVGESPLH